MKYSELEQSLRKAGCFLKSKKGGHPQWYSPITGKTFGTSHHKNQEVASGTLKKIIRDSGVKL
jgi:predicted RNA binding protein YcfA (HicA-like mRNA interferase family)